MGPANEDDQDSLICHPVFQYPIIPLATHGMKVSEKFL
jgi:hypothetical protein